MKKQILVPMILAFFFLTGEAFAGNGIMHGRLFQTNPVTIGETHTQPDSSSMKTHHQMKSGNMKMQKSDTMGNMMMNGNKPTKCDSAKLMRMMGKMGNMNMKGMDSAARSKMMKQHMSMMMKMMSNPMMKEKMMKMMNSKKSMKCDSTKRKKMMGQMGNMDMKAGNTTHAQMKNNSSLVRKGIIDVEALDKNKDGKLYEDVMDFNVISDKPGVCPICGMKLHEMTIQQVKENLKKHGFKYK